MSRAIIDLTDHPEDFFGLLPEDWRVGIEPFWPEYQSSSKIFGIEQEGQVAGGGILFTTVSPDTLSYKEEAQRLFHLGLHYFGFLWIDPEHRGKSLGSFWIKEVQNRHPDNPLWLSIEEKDLQSFYEKNGFTMYKEVHNDSGTKEWIMVPKELNFLQYGPKNS